MNQLDGLHQSVRTAMSGHEGACVVYEHSTLAEEITGPHDFAAALGYPVQRITKTLFLRSRDGQAYAAAVCSADRRLNFKSAAQAIGVKRVEAATQEELRMKTGYPRNGVSPLGLADGIAVVVDSPLLEYPTILVGGGAIGIEIELAPSDLIQISKGTVYRITT